jgi:hypothetical protein
LIHFETVLHIVEAVTTNGMVLEGMFVLNTQPVKIKIPALNEAEWIFDK